MLRQVILSKQKKWRWPTWDLSLANSTYGTARCTLTLRVKTSVLSNSQVENNNWIILDPLGNFYKINALLTVMALLNYNHFWITQAELCIKSRFVKVSFMFVTIFLDIYENRRRKNFASSCPKHPKIIETKMTNFYFYTSLWWHIFSRQ